MCFLKLPDRQGRFIVSCDASDKAVGFVLKQSDASGSTRPVDLFTDNESLEWLLTRTKPENSGRLWRWVDKFREFQCKAHHIAGSRNTVADALSRVQGVKAVAREAWSQHFP